MISCDLGTSPWNDEFGQGRGGKLLSNIYHTLTHSQGYCRFYNVSFTLAYRFKDLLQFTVQISIRPGGTVFHLLPSSAAVKSYRITANSAWVH